MKTTSRKTLSAVLVLAMVFALFAAMTITASAANASDLAGQINSFPHGGTGTLTATASGNTVTVTGSVTGGTERLDLRINPEVTVIWKAEYSGSPPTYLINLLGPGMNGTFEVAQGAYLATDNIAYPIHSNVANIVVSGGTVSGKGTHVISGDRSVTVTVTGGLVEQTLNSTAINSDGIINMSGGTVSSTGSAAIRSGGTIEISGGTVINTGTGVAINSHGDDSSLTISGGVVESQNRGQTIDAYYTIITGGIVRNTGETSAIIISRNLVMTGGTVSAVADHTIRHVGVNASFNISGGFVFAYGTAAVNTEVNNGARAAIRNFGSGSQTIVSGVAVACAWNNPGSAPTYEEGSSTDLIVAPEGATATWGKSGSQDGIYYKNGSNTGFFPISDVTVNAEAATFTVTFDSNGGSPMAPQTVNSGGLAQYILPNPTREGYGFGGWHADEALTKMYDFNTPVTADITLYAKWVAAAGFTVNFNSNGGSSVASQTVAADGKATRPSDPTRAGYTFAGWFSNTTLTTAYNFDTAVTANITLYAKWEVATSAGTGSMENFLLSRTYTSGMFDDINEDAWYGYNKEKAVANAYEYGLMSGYPDNTFRPTGNITIAEAITVAARVHSIYTKGTDNFVQGTPWFQVYIDYAITNGIITANDFAAYNQLATRREMAYIFANAVPKAELSKQNTVNSLPDVNNATPYAQSIIMLYEAGVIGGSDTAGTFNPGNYITRAEAAAIISRVILPSERFSGRTYG